MMKAIFFAVLATLALNSNAFVTPQSNTISTRNTQTPPIAFPSLSESPITTTSLMARQWNFNEGRKPWGLKNNAEIWNGRVAQMGFVIVFLQELATGKGVVAGFQDGDLISYVMLGLTVFSVVGLTIWLAIEDRNKTFIDRKI
mmetsp:Transcript_11965/g.14063  ORF Transcript_11965/g.14063 Transcript_11965/m.14063 type:complete len:143 (-) Transcript_11965:278-706(-)